MSFAAFLPLLALFLGLLTTLAGLPADSPYFHPWHDGPQSYRASQDLYRPPFAGGADPRVGGGVPAFGQRTPPYGTPPREWWYQLEQGGGGAPGERRGFAPRRRSDSVPGNEYPGVQNIEKSYSSHVNYGAAHENNEATEKTPKNFRENFELIFGSPVPGKIDERINFEEGFRNVRTWDPKEADIPDPRIVTPKGGRRPPQGSSPKNQHKPFGPGSSNPIFTTEKTFRNQTMKGPKKPRPTNSKPQGGDIVFPDGFPKKFIPRIAKCAKKSTFCEHLGDEYPSDYINQVLKKEGATFREFFGRDVISDPNITERINAPEENSLCPYRQEVVFPRAAQNKEDKWLFIVNQDQYVQGVTVEVCLNPESRCILTEGFPLGYTPYCKQKYIERRLVAIGEDGKPHSDSFRLPSCCSCVVKHETSARTGLLRSSGEPSPPP